MTAKVTLDQASDIQTDTTNFDNSLSASDTNVQKALETIDEMSGGSGTPGGSDTQVQFNDGGSFAGNAALTFNKTTKVLTVNADIILKAGQKLIFDGV